MEGTGCGLDEDWGDWLLEETVAKVGTLEGKVVGLLVTLTLLQVVLEKH